jgi:hypothetical protein
MRVAIAPTEADSPLVVYANAERPRTISLQRLELITGRLTKIFQPPRLIQVQKLPPRGPFDRLKSPDHMVFKKRCCIPATKRTDQFSFYDARGIMSNVMANRHSEWPFVLALRLPHRVH